MLSLWEAVDAFTLILNNEIFELIFVYLSFASGVIPVDGDIIVYTHHMVQFQLSGF